MNAESAIVYLRLILCFTVVLTLSPLTITAPFGTRFVQAKKAQH